MNEMKYNHWIDLFNEEDWDEVEPDYTFLTWLKNKYPDENTWKDLTMIDCTYQNLTDLIGIDKLINLEYLFCNNNKLINIFSQTMDVSIRKKMSEYGQNLVDCKGAERIASLLL